jgi:hypothetical protein
MIVLGRGSDGVLKKLRQHVLQMLLQRKDMHESRVLVPVVVVVFPLCLLFFSGFGLAWLRGSSPRTREESHALGWLTILSSGVRP